MELFSSNFLKSSETELVRHENHDEEDIASNEAVTGNALVSASSRDVSQALAFSFAELGVSDWLCETTSSLGYRRPTIVQSSCIPGILQGKDVMACAETGSGKTATFVIPMLQILAQDPYGIFSVILTPTRELALQIADQISALGTSLQVTTALVIGGMNMMQQSIQLAKRPHFVIATPGRLRAHLEGAEPPSISRARFLVLDEADRLLALGFAAELSVILKHINPRRQTLLFSATLTQTLEDLQALALRDGATLRHNSTQEAIAGHHGRKLPSTLTQQYVVVPSKLKLCFLVLLLSKFFSPTANDSAENNEKGKGKKKALSIESATPAISLAEAIASKKSREELSSKSTSKPNKKKRKFSGKDSDFAFVEKLLQQRSSTGNSRLSQVIIFVESCTRCHELSLTLQELLSAAHRRGFTPIGSSATADSDNSHNEQYTELTCVSLHGMLTQTQRLQNLQAFRDVHARILVATDVASRGLDLQAVDLVISYDLPRVAADYVHRAGRTARAGRRGTSTTMVTPHDIALLQAIEQSCETRLEAREDILIGDTQPLLLPVSKAVQSVQLTILSSDFKEKEEKFKERKRKQKKEEQRHFGDQHEKERMHRRKEAVEDLSSKSSEGLKLGAGEETRLKKEKKLKRSPPEEDRVITTISSKNQPAVEDTTSDTPRVMKKKKLV